MKTSLLLFLYLVISSCGTEERKTQTHLDSKIELEVLDFDNPCEEIDFLISQIDSIRYAPYDLNEDSLLLVLNQKVAILAEGCAQKTLDGVSYSEEKFNIKLAEDSLFGIISWNTQMGGTMTNFEHLKFWKTNSGIKSYNSFLNENQIDNYHDTYFTEIANVVTQDGKTMYLCFGCGQGSSCLPWFTIEAFQIIEKKVKPSIIFPDNNSRLSVSYDLCNSGSFESILRFNLRADGDLDVPIISENGEPYHQTFYWKDNRFIQRFNYESFIPEEYTILELQKEFIYSDNKDGIEDLVMILRDTVELNDDIWNLQRPLIILKGTSNGYDYGAKGNHVVMCQDCGGMFGDPFDFLDVSYKKIVVAHYGGSSEKWYNLFTFELNSSNEEWELISNISGWYEWDIDQEGNEFQNHSETVETNEDFGIVKLEDFGKE